MPPFVEDRLGEPLTIRQDGHNFLISNNGIHILVC
jgi:hypothetical protein